jgi:hypothetical protein
LEQRHNNLWPMLKQSEWNTENEGCRDDLFFLNCLGVLVRLGEFILQRMQTDQMVELTERLLLLWHSCFVMFCALLSSWQLAAMLLRKPDITGTLLIGTNCFLGVSGSGACVVDVSIFECQCNYGLRSGGARSTRSAEILFVTAFNTVKRCAVIEVRRRHSQFCARQYFKSPTQHSSMATATVVILLNHGFLQRCWERKKHSYLKSLQCMP